MVKIGRTHLEDAVPLTVGQEWSEYAHQLTQAVHRVTTSADGLYELAAGGTAVGTGLNAPPGFAEAIAAEIAELRWLASGPRCGIGELILPANEPGSSIMPGKVNPTQCEAMVMVCIQVLSEDSAIAFAGSQGNFELNAMRPVIINNFLHAATILADACGKPRQYCIEGTELNRETCRFA